MKRAPKQAMSMTVAMLLLGGAGLLACAAPQRTKVARPSPGAPAPIAVPPRVVDRAIADYPGLAKMPTKDIEVVMNVGVDPGGVVRTVVVTHSGGQEFDQAARGALFKTRFSPGRRDDGTPVDSVIEYRYLFKAQAPPPK